ncbi:DUF2975 domain-containing protein [Qipengyuania gaetbuli]|uniref:DUF2975 domain-containing protein n=1 Tax=Qipengyuania gaetbuli TaxID=266952 RepID=UPI001CFD3B31|nr:DUF2975 domain-containing protein [Qipengyuania gaetbuli]
MARIIPNDPLLATGKVLALILQGLCALAGVILFAVMLLLVLISQDLADGIVNANEFELIDNSLVSYIAILVMLSAIVAALFAFFGKMRAIIVSVGEGDPFIAENAQRLGSMAWLLLGVEVLAVLVGLVRLYLANLASGGGDRLGFSIYDLTGPVMVLVLFILARVFRKGTEMRADLEGTV